MTKFLLSAVVLMFGTSVFAAEPKFGYIDMQKAIQATEAGKKARKELENEVNSKKKEWEAKDKDLKKIAEDLNKKSMVLSDEVKQKKGMEFQEDMLKFRESVAKGQQALQEKERQLTAPILEKLKTIIDEIGEKESYTAILEKSENSVWWTSKKNDLTDRVVTEFNKKHK